MFRKPRFTLLVAGIFLVGLFGVVSCRPAKPEKNFLQKAEGLFNQYGPRIKKKQYLIIIDYDLPVFRKRLWVIDRSTGDIVVNAHVSHSWWSGFLTAKNFSNAPQSYQSSKGAFVTAEAYSGKYGYAMRIDGLEPKINDQARWRAIVFHSPRYFLWSHGCFMTFASANKEIIDLTKNGTLMYVHRSKS